MNKVRLEKARALEKWNRRADYDATLRVVDNTKNKATAMNYNENSSSEDNGDD